MKVVQKKTNDGVIELDCTASTADVSMVLNAMQRQFCMQMGINVPNGKTPAECAEAQMGIRDLDKVVEPQAIEALVPFALEKRGLVPAFKPAIEPKGALRRGKTYGFTLKVTPKPEYDLSSYDPVEITVDPEPDCTEEVNNALAELAEQYCMYVEDEARPVKKGDDVKLNMRCSVNGEDIKNLCTDGRTYTVGLGYMPEGFDENILGMAPGEKKEFQFEAPDIDEKGNEITITVDASIEIVEIQKRVAPVIDDEWVTKNMPMYKSLEELTEDVRRGVSKQKKFEYDIYVRNVAAEALAERFVGTIPDEVYEGTMDTLVSNLRQEVGSQGMTWDQFVEQNGGEKNLNMMLMMQARSVLRQGYAMDAVFRSQGLVISDDDIMDVCRQINPRDPKRARKQFEDSGNGETLRESAERCCANKWVVKHANITVREAPIDNRRIGGGATQIG